MSDANRVGIKYVQESTFGVTPATPTMKTLRLTGESLKQDTTTTQSNELRADRAIADYVRVGLKGSGEIQCEMSLTSYDDFIEAASCSTFTAQLNNLANATGNLQFASGDNSINRTSGSFVSDGYVVGDFIKGQGWTNASNNGIFQVVSVVALKMVLRYGTVVTESSTSPVVGIGRGAKVTNGTTFRSFAIQRQYADLSNEFAMFNGMAIDTWNGSCTPESILTHAFGFMGKKELSATTDAASVTTAATTTGILNAIDNVQFVGENNAVYGVTELTWALQNNLRARLQVGTLGAISLGMGSINLTGTHKAYYATKNVMDRYLNFTAVPIVFALTDGTTNALVLEVPQAKYTDGKRVAGGINTDILADMAWAAKLDPTTGAMFRIWKWVDILS